MMIMNPLLSISIFFFLFTISSYASLPSYKDHCASILQESTPTNLIQSSFPFTDHQSGYFKGGSRIIQVSTSSNKYSTFYLQPRHMHETQDSNLFKIEATLSFRSNPNTVYYHRGNFSFGDKSRYVGQRHYHRNYVTFKLDGFWSKSLGKVCMVGKGSGYSKTGDSLNLDAVFKLSNVFNQSNITSLVTGSLESLSSKKYVNYFETISVLMFPKENYDYTLDSKEVENEFSSKSDIAEKGLSLKLDSMSFCSYQLSRVIRRLQLEYSSECSSSKNCTPIGGSSDQLPFLMSLRGIECSKHRLRVMVMFSNISDYWINKGFDPKTVLVGEGWWNEKKNELYVVACHVQSTHVGDCSVRLRLKFPSIWSIKNTNNIVGQIWSNKSANDPEYFKMITFRNFEDDRAGFRASKYEYSQLKRVEQSCPAQKVVKNKGKRFPDAYSYNMRFDMSVKESNRRVGWGYSYPLSIADEVYGLDLNNTVAISVSEKSTAEIPLVILNNGSLFNISYKITMVSNSSLYDKNSLFNLSSSRVKISAEGIYDSGTGTLCMIGCRDLPSKTRKPIAATVDCEILLKFQFPSLDSGSYIKGVVESTRKKLDPLYFKSLELYSAAFYTETAIKAVWRMDMEIIMVLISTTLAVVFVGLQLYHVKRNPDVLPFISLIMMSILTLGYMIPLVLNFEALLTQNPNNKNFVFGNVGWLEVNEIAVRLITMLAFLLQFRLLQLTWSSRNANEDEKGLWIAERKAIIVTLPLYVAGLLIALLLKLKNDGDTVAVTATLVNRQHHSSWENIKSYGGLVLDGFLLPQIILNLFSNMKENVLSCSFYFGTTFVRLLPHAYDLYRTRNYARLGNGSYFYADPSADFYSTAWDIAIPFGGILLAIFIYFQQRFGSQYVLPHRFRGSKEYEKVPVVTESETEVVTSNL